MHQKIFNTQFLFILLFSNRKLHNCSNYRYKKKPLQAEAF